MKEIDQSKNNTLWIEDDYNLNLNKSDSFITIIKPNKEEYLVDPELMLDLLTSYDFLSRELSEMTFTKPRPLSKTLT